MLGRQDIHVLASGDELSYLILIRTITARSVVGFALVMLPSPLRHNDLHNMSIHLYYPSYANELCLEYFILDETPYMYIHSFANLLFYLFF